jgi:hypothetical protein
MPSVKLCVTVKRNLEKKYDQAALQEISRAAKDWTAAEAKRGIQTAFVAVDDAAAMKTQGVTPISGKATAAKIKRAVDALWNRLNPDYLVLFGGDEIVPMFVVANPSYDPGGDDDRQVPTDNPYASSAAFRASNRSTYLVPDRVVGRIPDMVSDPNPAWLVDYLAVATTWTSRPASYYAALYATCCDEWKGAGTACVQYLGAPPARLLITPPTTDSSASARTRLSSRLHMIKCHGAPLDPKFYGQKGNDYPVSLASATLKPRLKPATLAAAMCCYGAQIYSPTDPAAQNSGDWPLASTYLRKGALGFAGSTMIAWVGLGQMMCADWIVASYLKGALGGASLGRAFLEAKQDYVRWINQQGHAPDLADEKTLIEYVLLGDPAIHPVGTVQSVPAKALTAAMAHPALALLSQERWQRRILRAQLGGQIRELLPERTVGGGAALARAKQVFQAAQARFGADVLKDIKAFAIRPTAVRVEKLDTPLSAPVAADGPGFARAKAPAIQSRQSIEYYWSGRRVRDGHREIRLMKAETDQKGNVLRTSVVHSS